jgi:hypothetical protein
MLRDALGAQIDELEKERAEHRKKIERLRAAELAAPRKRSAYFHLARLIIGGLCPEIVMPWLRTPEALRKTAKALEITEKDVDRGGLRVVSSFLAALREHLKRPYVHDVSIRYELSAIAHEQAGRFPLAEQSAVQYCFPANFLTEDFARIVGLSTC